MPAYVGRDVLIEYAIAPETALKTSLVYSVLGMMRGKEMTTSWDTVDSTGDKSPSFTRQSLVTFKQVEFSGDGVSYDDAVHNQVAFEAHSIKPAASTGNQPKVWLRVTYPNKVYEGPFIITEFSNSSAFDAEATFSLTAQSNGDVTLTAL